MQLVRLCLTLAGLLTAQTVEAQPYKCTVEGKIVYQQVKCPGAESVNTSGAGKADTTSQAAIQASREVAYYKRQERVNAAIAEGKIFVGMTRDEVL